MGPIVTVTGTADSYLIRGAIWEQGRFAYRAYVCLAPAEQRRHAAPLVVSVDGPTMQKVLDTAIARVMTATGKLVENIEVRAAQDSGGRTSEPQERALPST
jgi:hypothetical protein